MGSLFPSLRRSYPYQKANALPAIYLSAFGPLRSVFRLEELDELFATMVERQIRIRRDIEDYLEGWVRPDVMDVDEKDQESDVGDQELEAVVNEQDRLKPF